MKNKDTFHKDTIVSVISLVVIVLGIVIFSIWFNYYNNIARTVLYINDRPVSKLEYDYYYHTYYNSYMNDYALIIGYMNIDTSKELLDQMYDDTRTFRQYFNDCAIDQLIKINALYDDGQSNGYEYNYEADYEQLMTQIREQCNNVSVPVNDYFKKYYGSNATYKNVAKYLKIGFYVTGYYEHLCEEMGCEADDDQIFDYVKDLKDKYEITYR